MDTWDISQKTVAITGATDGIGKAVARALMHKGAHVVVFARDTSKAKQLGNIEVIECDLASFASIRSAALEYQRRFNKLDVLINVAGVMPVEEAHSKDGIELAMAVNYFAPVLLTELLLPIIEKSTPARIINVTSSLYKRGVIDLEHLRGAQPYNRYKAYGDSKLALMLYTHSLAARYTGKGIVVNAVHPGWIRTKLAIGALKKSGFFVRNLFTFFRMRPAWYGARTIVYLASDPAAGEVSGKYFIKKAPVETKPIAHDTALAEALYIKTKEILGE